LPNFRHKTMKKNNMIKSTKKKETMKNEIMLNHYDNQSHGYVKISEYDLKGIGIDIEKIGSQYSFYNEWNGVYYFEEDCDANKLIKELNNKGYSVKFKYNHVGINFLNSPDIKRINV
jgi:hypothetical protein